MDLKNRSILVIGAGAVGGITAASLARAEFDVELVCKYNDYRDLVMSEGIKVSGVVKSFTQKIKAYSTIEDVNGKRDIILLAVKANDVKDVAERIKPLLNDNTIVVAMQNGIVEFELYSLLGKERVAGCIVGWGATMRSPGDLLITSDNDFVLGYLDNDPDEKLEEVREILSSFIPSRTVTNMVGHRYSKLIINSCITSLGAISGLNLGRMLRRRKARLLFIEIINEAMELAHIMKINVEPYGGKFNYYDFIKLRGVFGRLKQHITISYIGFKYRRLKSSSLQSLQRGNRTEIDYLNGYIAVNGREFGVPVPVNIEITRQIHEIEEGNMKITPLNFDDVAFEKY